MYKHSKKVCVRSEKYNNSIILLGLYRVCPIEEWGESLHSNQNLLIPLAPSKIETVVQWC